MSLTNAQGYICLACSPLNIIVAPNPFSKIQFIIFLYIPPRSLHMQLVCMPVFTLPDTVDVTYQDFMFALSYTRMVVN